jgi:hypothetical protein
MFNIRVLGGRIRDAFVTQPCMFRRLTMRAAVAILVTLLGAVSVSRAYGQTFSISIPNGLDRPAVDPGGSAIGTIVISSSSTGTLTNPIGLACSMSSGPATTNPPVCTVSPVSETGPGSASLTITTSNGTGVGLYSFTVTGTGGGTQTLSLNLTVQPLSQDYTLSATPTTAVPNPVAPGAVATTTVSIAPIGSYSGHQVTLACLSVTPVVTAAPTCSFQPTSGSGAVRVTSGTPATATLTITTFGPIPVTGLRTRRIFYALWLLIPGVALAGAAKSGKRGKKLTAIFFLVSLGGGVLLMPGCGSSTATNSPNGMSTPKNTYVFTLTGADENGAAPSNTTADAATVSITVN